MSIAETAIQNELKPGYFRADAATVADEAEVTVDRNGGKYRAGLLSGVSLISRGEALGHAYWIDDTALEQVSELANRRNAGVKARFAHPSMSNDGIGRHLGRVRDTYVEDSQVRGYLHFQESAHDTPEGDLASYVMSLADEDPQAAGLSIVFEHNPDEELQFALENGAALRDGLIDFSEFVSPDSDNVHNYPHLRLRELRAADVVDEPAANPDGLFHIKGGASSYDTLLSYVVGESDETPEGCYPVDPERARQFLARWLESRSLSLVPIEVPMDNDSTNSTPAETPVEPTAENQAGAPKDELLAALGVYTDAFGAETGLAYFTEGRDLVDCYREHCEELGKLCATLEDENEELKTKLAELSIGEEEPVDVIEIPTKRSPFRFAASASEN